MSKITLSQNDFFNFVKVADRFGAARGGKIDGWVDPEEVAAVRVYSDQLVEQLKDRKRQRFELKNVFQQSIKDITRSEAESVVKMIDKIGIFGGVTKPSKGSYRFIGHMKDIATNFNEDPLTRYLSIKDIDHRNFKQQLVRFNG